MSPHMHARVHTLTPGCKLGSINNTSMRSAWQNIVEAKLLGLIMIDEDAGLQSCHLPLLSFFSFYLRKHLNTDAKSAVKTGKDAAYQDLKASKRTRINNQYTTTF